MIAHTRIIVEGEESLLGIRTGIEPRGYIAQQVAALARRPAMLIRHRESTEWPIRRVVPLEGEFHLAGPLLEGATVEELLSRVTVGSPPAWLTGFLRAIVHSLSFSGLHPGNIRTCFVTARGDLLLYDAELARELNRSIPLQQRALIHDPYTQEHLTGNAARAYQGAAILYHALTGSAPKPREEGGAALIPPVHRFNVAVHTAIATAMDAILSGESGREEALLQEIAKALESNHGEWLDAVPPAEQKRRGETATLLEEQTRKAQERRTFWRKNRNRLLLGALIAVAVGSIPVSIIRTRLQPPRTAGLPPLELVEGYYRAWTELDHAFMEDALASGVERNTIREVTNLYVIERVQSAHAMHSRLIPPREWLDEGMPTERVPYGVADLEVVPGEGAHAAAHDVPASGTPASDTPEARVRARYTMWRPLSGEAGITGVLLVTVQDDLELSRTRHGWEISAIHSTVLQEEELPLPAANR